MEAKTKCHSSFAWTSMLAAKELLKQGIIWHVGNGKSIKVWNDKWLPSPTLYTVQTLINTFPAKTKVSDLILSDSNNWNQQLIKEVFWETEAELILNIPISQTGRKDKLVWYLTNNGLFSVKSAYYTALSITRSKLGEPSQRNNLETSWKSLWNLHIPNKTNKFSWRACTDSLLTKSKLKERRITQDGLCPICHREDETIIHLVWNCLASKDIWTLSTLHKWPDLKENLDQL